jgi:hypothetical protein
MLPLVSAGFDQTICIGDMATLTSPSTGLVGMDWSTGAQGSSTMVSPTASITYTFLGTDANGCMSTDTVMVNVNMLPLVSAGIDQTICVGDMATLSSPSTGLTGMDWSTGAQGSSTMVSPFVSMTYTFLGTDANGCMSTDTVMVNVNMLPIVTFTNPADVCEGSAAVSLTTGLPAVGTYSGNGVSTGMFDAVVTGVGSFDLYYSHTDVNGCTAMDTAQIIVNANPIITWTAFNDLCEDGTAITLNQASPAPGTYSGTGVSGGTFDPAVSGVGTFSITYDYTDVNSCSASSGQNINVNGNPVIDLGVDTLLCNNIPSITLDAGVTGTYVWYKDGSVVAGQTNQTMLMQQ